jgi:predicted transposase YdaD
MPPIQDSGYKLLFSHPEMVRDLLIDYIPGDWVKQADFSTLERVNASYVSPDMKQRHDDMVWRLKIQDQWTWVYLVLEFQSESDPWMALRMLVYVGLLAQDLVRQGHLNHGQIPPVVPVVLYNGQPLWRAPVQVQDLFAPPLPGLDAFVPRMAYHLIDEARLMLHPSNTVRTAVEALFKLERSQTPQDLHELMRALAQLLQTPETRPLRAAFGAWLKHSLRRKIPTNRSPDLDGIDNLLEADAMLAERIEGWFEEKWRQGVLEGLQKGKQEGLHEGLERGLERGVQQGEAALLMRLLTRRFGQLPESVDMLLSQASTAELEAWGERVLDAATLDEVFKPH